MATEWVKMRVGLRKHPKTIAMARILMSSRDFVTWLSSQMNYINHLDDKSVTKSVTEFVTREIVTRVTVAALIEVWGAVNTSVRSDLRVPYMQLDDLDGITGIASFGQAMAAVGWVREFSNDKTQGLLFPNFSEFNNPESERIKAKTPAERAAEYRARKKGDDDASRSVTKRHASSRVEDQNRKDFKEQELPPLSPKHPELIADDPPAQVKVGKRVVPPAKHRGEPERFPEFYALYPRKVARPKAAQAFAKLTEADQLAAIAAVPLFARSWDWRKEGGQFVPHPTTWLNQRRWEDRPPPEHAPIPDRQPVRQSRQAAVFETLANDHRHAETAARLANGQHPQGLLAAHPAESGLHARAGHGSNDADCLDADFSEQGHR